MPGKLQLKKLQKTKPEKRKVLAAVSGFEPMSRPHLLDNEIQ